MATYVIFIRERTKDRAELEAYFKEASAAMIGHPWSPLAAYGNYEVLEGPDIEGAAILKFPSLADAKAWYESPAYQKASEHRFKGAEYRAIIVEGVAPTSE